MSRAPDSDDFTPITPADLAPGTARERHLHQYALRAGQRQIAERFGPVLVSTETEPTLPLSDHEANLQAIDRARSLHTTPGRAEAMRQTIVRATAACDTHCTDTEPDDDLPGLDTFARDSQRLVDQVKRLGKNLYFVACAVLFGLLLLAAGVVFGVAVFGGQP